ncbi:MAG TPA: hypothetical protein DEQ40_08440, partial [Oxalobacteraceae bacterium]|nr:hypothetical protein [Oxalobacteraceae bacterium]
MTIFFSGSASNGKGAFFDDDGFHTADQIPKDAVPVTPERYAELFGPNGQGGGGFMILPDANGAPSLVPVPPPSTEQLLANLRATRDNLLAASDWT